MPYFLLMVFALATGWLSGTSCLAGALQISTTTLEVVSPGSTSSMTLRNTGKDAINVQIRVLMWSQKDGVEELTPTREVVVSPPFAVIEPGREFTVRVVRVVQSPVQAEASYRLLIDELPKSGAGAGLGVKFALRYSIPVFFGPAARAPATLAWRAETGRGRVRLTATNAGDKRVRLSSLKVKASEGGNIISQDGLLGYVLSRASMSWTFPVPSGRTTSGLAIITADSDSGPFNARIPLAPLP